MDSGQPGEWLNASALRALAVAAEKVPGVDAAGVAVLPVELDGVAAYGVGAGGARGGLVHLQELFWFRLGVARLAVLLLPLFDAGGAGAGVAQPGEVPVAAVAVFPIDLHAGAFGLEDTYFAGRESLFAERTGAYVYPLLALLFFFR